jgi:hypothetical protein
VHSTFRLSKPKRRFQPLVLLRGVPPAQNCEKPFKPNIKTQRGILTQGLSLRALGARATGGSGRDLSQRSQRTQSYEKLQKEDLMLNGSLKSAMGRLFGGENKLAYFTLQTGSTLTPMQFQRDACSAGLLSDPRLFSVISVSSSEAGER